MLGKLIRMIKGGYYELWYLDHPICSEIWHKLKEPTPYGKTPNCLCRGKAIKSESYKGIQFFITEVKHMINVQDSVDDLIKSLSVAQAYQILDLVKKDDFYHEPYVRRLGNALHEHYLWTNDKQEPIFPELYYEPNNAMANYYWKYFLKQLQKTLDHTIKELKK